MTKSDSFLVLLPMGFTRPDSYLPACELLPHPFTLARQSGGFLSVALSFELPQPAVNRHRRPAELGLSSSPEKRSDQAICCKMIIAPMKRCFNKKSPELLKTGLYVLFVFRKFSVMVNVLNVVVFFKHVKHSFKLLYLFRVFKFCIC